MNSINSYLYINIFTHIHGVAEYIDMYTNIHGVAEKQKRLTGYTHTHTQIYIYEYKKHIDIDIGIHMYACTFICTYIYMEKGQEREKSGYGLHTHM